MKQSKTIIFFGNERLATGTVTQCLTLKALIDSGYKIAAVVLHNESSTSRKQKKVEILDIARQHNIPILSPSKLSDIADDLKQEKAIAGVLVAFGKIIPQPIIDIFPKGIINLHPSRLPEHRGPTPLESIILNGENETAISVMQLTKEMDAGPVFAQRTISVPSNVTKQQLADTASEIGSKMIVQNLPAIIEGSLKPSEQDHSKATYDSLISKADGHIDWKASAEIIERQIRAYQGWPKSTASIGNHQLIITQASVNKTSGKPGDYISTKKTLTVFCGQDALDIIKVQPVNKKEMPIQAFLSGYSL